jgi:glyoxylase-like metal-dependent hydrolase (beta-lactamase superfamily II)
MNPVELQKHWYEPGCFDVAPGVHRIPLPLHHDSLRAINVYVVTGTGGPKVIDSGWSIPQSRSALEAGLRELDYSPADITGFFITHIHRDHFTQAVQLRREYGMPIWLGAGERQSLEALQRPGRMALDAQLKGLAELDAAPLRARLAAAIEPPSPQDQWELPDHWLTDGTELAAPDGVLRAVATPGHTQGHVVFHDAGNSRWFTGDHILPTITPSIGFEQVLPANPLADFLASLALVLTEPDGALLPAHGLPSESTHARATELLGHHDSRLDTTEAALDHAGPTVSSIAAALTWTRREKSVAELDPFNQMLAIYETSAHLKVLQAQNRVTSRHQGGLLHYYRV